MGEPATVIDLGGNLVLRSMRDDSDIARLVEMYPHEHGPVEGRRGGDPYLGAAEQAPAAGGEDT